MATISVLLSTYNGQKYITEQIQSILKQTFSDFVLYIRDDGSSDDTLNIIHNLASTDSRIVIINDVSEDTNTNLGFGESFSTISKYALTHSDCSYFAFCDQDDYWEEDKLEIALSYFEKANSDTPILFASNYYICDDVLNVTGTFNETNPMTGVTFENLFFEGVFPGFTMMINRKLAELSFDNNYSKDIYYHDKWVTLIALGLNGQIIYSEKPLAKYRRHSNAVSSTNLGIIKKIKWRVDKVLNGDFCPRTRQMLKCFSELFYSQVDTETKSFLDVFNSKKIFKKTFYPKHLRRSFSGEVMLRLILLLGKL